MLGKLLKKVAHFFVEKTKPVNNFYVENLNHLSWNKSPANYVQKVVSKNNKRKQLFQILIVHWHLETFKMINRLLKK